MLEGARSDELESAGTTLASVEKEEGRGKKQKSLGQRVKRVKETTISSIVAA